MKKFFTLIAVAVMAFAAQANELTVCEGMYYSNSSPLCGLYADTEGTMTQSIYPASMLTEMAGNQITAVKFYTLAYYYVSQGVTDDDETDYINFDGAKFQLSLKEVDQLGFEEAVAVVGATAVATCVPEYGDMEVVFTLDEPFAYNGQNLLVEVTCVETDGDWGNTYFFGSGVDGYNCAYYYIDDEVRLASYLPMATFTYEAGQVTPPVVDQVGAPTFEGYTEDGVYGYGVNILPTTEGSSIMYRVLIDVDGEWVVVTDWTQYMGTPMEIWMSQELAKYRVEAYAFIGDVVSTTVAYEYQVQPWTSINEMNAGKSVAGVRYFNLAGQEMQEANGVTIVVTTYTDGTTSAAKVVK